MKIAYNEIKETALVALVSMSCLTRHLAVNAIDWLITSKI